MKNLFLVLPITIFFLSTKTYSQLVQGKIVDENQNGLADINLELYINSNVYNTSTSSNGSFNITITQINEPQLPKGFRISNNFPNPFNPKTRIGITLPNNGNVKIEAFNLLGQRVIQSIEKSLLAGTSFIDIELNGMPNGIYLFKVNLDDRFTVVKKAILLYNSQHLSVMEDAPNIQPSKNSIFLSTQDQILDSLVASNSIVGRKTFTNLPNLTGNLLDLGKLMIERFCPETPTVLYEGKLYHTVKIGNQCWLKENLNFGIKINGNQNQMDNDTIEKYCYGNNEANCEQYGGFYQWDEAMQYATTTGFQGICPDDWHVPTLAESGILRSVVGYNAFALLAQDQGGVGTNRSGFTALLIGDRDIGGNFLGFSYDTNFWLSTENITPPYNLGYNIGLTKFSSSIFIGNTDKRYGFCVRCIKD